MNPEITVTSDSPAVQAYVAENLGQSQPQAKPGSGDIDGDGAVSVKDVIAVQKYLIGAGTANKEADVNGDGTVDIFDLALIKNKAISPLAYDPVEDVQPTDSTLEAEEPPHSETNATGLTPLPTEANDPTEAPDPVENQPIVIDDPTEATAEA